MSDFCKISFPGTDYLPLTLQPHKNLSEHLTIQNSPVLFGCRTGICGTCLIEVIGDIPPAQSDEQETLETLAANIPNVRLACQVELTGNVQVRKV
ncbi:(2Fe-2S)-binding protein [Nostoc sp. LEGE 12447]|uniref:2Fe-2S iron-sulfur cluster-binding protein n=1 Tax=Nostoc sp. LEGE 12447 TaxID=1828640 RepID=UPI001880DA27|nr:2Fe-2S iron-sulfur cluster-binding protein [Nostoc sp. LEGE 12447]MBE8996754.1 (2Fe-2S)-binding protein [Nostoc sp. LEGE 12447]